MMSLSTKTVTSVEIEDADQNENWKYPNFKAIILMNVNLFIILVFIVVLRNFQLKKDMKAVFLRKIFL